MSSFKYGTYLKYQLNITQKSKKIAFEIVYWSQNVVINICKVCFLFF